MEPRIQYAKIADGVSIAFWTLGEGVPFVHMPVLPWSHIQLEWQDPGFRRWYERLAEKRKLVRYDGRRSGLSERDAADYSVIVESSKPSRAAGMAAAEATLTMVSAMPAPASSRSRIADGTKNGISRAPAICSRQR